MLAKINNPMIRCFVWVTVMALLGILLVGALPALAETAINVSGYEVFPGVKCNVGGATTCGVIFVGKPVDGQDKDRVGFTIRYSGTAGIGHAVTVKGGFWTLVYLGKRYEGTVKDGGSVQWPDAVGGTVEDCEPNQAYINADLRGDGMKNFRGCLTDLDANGNPVFPHPAPINGQMTLK